MRVAFVQPTPDADTVLARRMRRTAEAFADREHEVTVLCLRWWDGERSVFERNGVTYRAVAGSTRWFAASLPTALSGMDSDVIHAAGSAPGAALAARLSWVPLVLEWCGETRSRLLDRALRSADRVCVPSEHVRTEVRERGTDATVVPGSVDVEAIATTEPIGSAEIVWSGRLHDGANLGSFLLALAELGGGGPTAAVIGDGPERGRYERLARDLGIEGRISFHGRLPEPERMARLKRAHVFVHTADRCPFAVELLMALACGCVGIVEYQPDSAAHELIAGYERGFGVTDDEGIIDAIEAAQARSHQEYAPRFERFSTASVCERYLAAYRDAGVKPAEDGLIKGTDVME